MWLSVVTEDVQQPLRGKCVIQPFTPSSSDLSLMLTWAWWFEEIQTAGLMSPETKSKRWIVLPQGHHLVKSCSPCFTPVPPGPCEALMSDDMWPHLCGRASELQLTAFCLLPRVHFGVSISWTFLFATNTHHNILLTHARKKRQRALIE